MTRAAWWGMGVAAFILLAPKAIAVPLLLVPLLAFVVTYRHTRRKATARVGPPPPTFPEGSALNTLRPQWWGYVIPWDMADPQVFDPAYVGITSRGPDVSGWLPRWDDDDHVLKRTTYPLAYDRATVVELVGPTTEAEAEAYWEYPLIRQLVAEGHRMLNVLGRT